MAPKFFDVRYLPIFSVVFVLSLWVWLVTRHLPVAAVAVFIALALVSVAAGDVFIRHTVGMSDRFDSFSTRFLLGFFIANIALYIVSFVSPFGLALDSLFVSLAVFAAWAASKKTGFRSLFGVRCVPESVFVLLALVAVTFWCRDILNPAEVGWEFTTIKAWQDIFYHARVISNFASAHGLGAVSDLQMAGAQAHPYHYASYIVPAVLANVTSVSSLEVFAGFQVPFGLLLTVLASFSLLSSLFGKLPGIAAGLTLAYAPDAMQQGFGNYFLSYHWLQQVSPAMLYGTALAALAWLFMFEGCRSGKFSLVATGYVAAFFTLLFKAQIFVAVSFLIWIYPALFMAGLKTRVRVGCFAAMTFLYLAVVAVSQGFANVPTLRLDGSGLAWYKGALLYSQSPGFLKDQFDLIFYYITVQMDGAWLITAIALAPMLFVGTFGIFGLLYPAFLMHLKKHFRPYIVLFPVLIAINYLVMSEGLALDAKNLGTPEELLHRPFVWAYFVACSWSGAALYHAMFDDRFPVYKHAERIAAAIICVAVSIPIYFGYRIQTMPIWPGGGFDDHAKIPTCLFKTALFIRGKSTPKSVVQDSLNDPKSVLAGLSEQQGFAMDLSGFRAPDGLKDRLHELRMFKDMDRYEGVVEFARRNSMDWYVLHPGDKVNWPEPINRRLAFQCGGYRTYYFGVKPTS